MLTIVTPPAALPVTREEVWEHLNLTLVPNDDSPSVDEPVDAAYVDELLAAAVSYLDGADGRLGKCLIKQTWNLKLDRFPPVIELPLAPLQAVTSVWYYDANGVNTQLLSENYQVAGIGAHGPGEMWPGVGKCWPSTQYGLKEAVSITFRAGFGDLPADVPASLRHAVKMLVSHWYENRETVSFANPTELPIGLRDLILSWRTRLFL
jgi:uncharacterized phiE125 gp8 family phage protein